jgi:acyl-CoA synthetase (AMP-forming)/AMP-acid ligase II
MMTGYHNAPAKTAEAEWFSPAGDRYIRTGDIASMDADGFVTLIGRAKDMIISGGFNVYPVDIESVLKDHPAVDEAAVIGVPSPEWGETPVAFVTARPGAAEAGAADPEAIRVWANDRLGKMQRISAVAVIDELPRSAIGKVLKRELQERWRAAG